MMFKSKSKKGFTLIELLAVIAIIAILVLLAAPKLLGYTKDAKLTQIKNDVKAYETSIASEVLDNEDFFDELVLVDNEDLIKYAEEGSLFNKKGVVGSETIIGSHFEIDRNKVKVDSKLKGQFFTNEKGLVLYHEKDFGIPKDEGVNEEEVYLPKDEDFKWVDDNLGYTAANQNRKGYYKYIGENQSVVEIPHVINGHPMTSYYKMFYNSGKHIEKVISTNKNITDMSYMFARSQAMTLDLSNFDTSEVTNMNSMFSQSEATSIDLSKFDTSKVTSMISMFYMVPATSLNLSSFDTSNVTTMNRMFAYSKATALDLSNFNTSKVADMGTMFANSQAKNINLSNFDTSEVTNMNAMFYESKAPSIDLSKFDTSKVHDMSYMFFETHVKTLSISNFDTSKVTDMTSMFEGSQAETLDLSSFNTSNVFSMNSIFKDAKATKGYARTQVEADRFNSSSYKPASLEFEVK